ncbi:MAG: S26 family signal peptidase [Haloferacaceae archaeon]
MSDDEGRFPTTGGEEGGSGPPAGGPDDAGPASSDGGPDDPGPTPIRALLDAERGPLVFVREALVSVAIVGLIGLLLFALSGVWPPMVAVESGSMEPHMHRGDLVFVSERGRYVPDGGAGDRGVVTRAEGERIDYRTFGGYGSVVVYDSPGRGGPPVIHRAQFWVAEGENWFDAADPAHHRADSCSDLPNCPAPHAGFITKGDANGQYDQANGISAPVRPAWIDGVAHARVPYLGYVRLWLVGGGNPPIGWVVDPAGTVPASVRAGASAG